MTGARGGRLTPTQRRWLEEIRDAGNAGRRYGRNTGAHLTHLERRRLVDLTSDPYTGDVVARITIAGLLRVPPRRVRRGSFDGAALFTSDDPAITRRSVAHLPVLVGAMRAVIARHDARAAGVICGCDECLVLEQALAEARLPARAP
jgi:hypothetical protein